MNSFFYSKLALSNLKKNAKTYIPYLLTCIITTSMFYIIYSLSINEGLHQIVGGKEIASLLLFGTIIIAIFSTIFLFYTNSFLVKRRKKEFGLFNILGMEKRHISRLVMNESLITLILSLMIGLFVGISLDKVMFLFIGKLLSTDVPLGFSISFSSIKVTCLLFIGIQIFICLNSIRQIHISNPIELLNSSTHGEKEPKSKWILTLLGIIFLGTGYYISITTTNPLSAFGLFFLAVLCVIIGTYLLFIAGSVTVLKLLKKNKHFYYQTNHFISISGMIYRMKQNAVGLANICILATMVLVTLSSTISLWVGIDDLVETRYPQEISLTYKTNDSKKIKQLYDDTYDLLNKENISIKDPMNYTYLTFSVLYENNQYITDREQWNVSSLNNAYNLFFITVDDYNKNFHSSLTLEPNEVFIYSNRTDFIDTKIHLFNKEYKVKKILDSFVENGNLMANVASTHYIVVDSMETMNEIAAKQEEVFGTLASTITHYMSFDTHASDEQNVSLFHSLDTRLDSYERLTIESRTNSYQSFIALYGGLMFLGLFLSVLFIMIAILIIYYKQITEGYEDKDRYEIMQKVGMDHKTVKKSINSQVLMVFFLPLVAAAIHTAFAFPMISRLLKVLMLNNTKLLIACTVGCIFVFGVIYVLVYLLTSKLYYSIVKRN